MKTGPRLVSTKVSTGMDRPSRFGSRRKALEILNSGRAYNKMKEIIKAQQGNIFDPENIKIGKFKYDVKTNKSGIVMKIDNKLISRIARIAGAPLNKSAGIYLHKHVGNKVKKHSILFTIYSESRQKLSFAKEVLKNANGFIIK